MELTAIRVSRLNRQFSNKHNGHLFGCGNSTFKETNGDFALVNFSSISSAEAKGSLNVFDRNLRVFDGSTRLSFTYGTHLKSKVVVSKKQERLKIERVRSKNILFSRSIRTLNSKQPAYKSGAQVSSCLKCVVSVLFALYTHFSSRCAAAFCLWVSLAVFLYVSLHHSAV